MTFKSFFLNLFFVLLVNLTKAQEKSIILGKPTNSSVTASILFDQNVDFYLEYGTQSTQYNLSTNQQSNLANVPDEIELTNLNPNTRYFYRMKYKPTGSSTFLNTPEYTFHTQRAPGSNFTFTLEADEHLYDIKGNRDMYQVTLANELVDHQHF